MEATTSLFQHKLLTVHDFAMGYGLVHGMLLLLSAGSVSFLVLSGHGLDVSI